MGQLCTFTLTRFPWRRAPVALATVARRRARLDRTPEATFARLLVTGHADRTSVGVDLRRWATFVVWRNEPDLGAWHRRHADLAAAEDCWTVLLELVSAHGRWAGEAVDAPEVAVPPAGPIAVLTRARAATGRLPALLAATQRIERERRVVPGLLASVSIGEWPLWVQGSFTLWSDVGAMRSFARGATAHRPVIRQTRADGWFAEELFARFRPVASLGSWDGRDPLAGW